MVHVRHRASSLTVALARQVEEQWAILAKMLSKSPDVRVGRCDVDLNDVDMRYFSEGTTPVIKLFVKGAKERPLRYKAESVPQVARYTVDSLLEFLVAQSSSRTPGRTILQAQFEAYAAKHRLGHSLRVLVDHLLRTIDEQAQAVGAPSSPRSGFVDAHRNWERCLAAILTDPSVHHVPLGHEHAGVLVDADAPSWADLAVLLRQNREAMPVALPDSQHLSADGLLEPRAGLPFTDHVLRRIEQLLVAARLPDEPLATLTHGLVHATSVSLPSRIFNLPPKYQQTFARMRNARPSGQLPQSDAARSWMTMVSAVTAVASAPASSVSKMLAKANGALQRLLQMGMPIDMAPHGKTLVHLVAAHGAALLPLLNQLFWSGANMQEPSSDEVSDCALQPGLHICATAPPGAHHCQAPPCPSRAV